MAAGRPCTSGIPSPPDTTTARPAVQCCAVPFPPTGCTVPCTASRRMASATRTVSIVLRAAESRRDRLSVDDTLALAARAVGPARHLWRLALILRPKGDAQREGAIDAAARGCGWRCGCACPTGLCATARGVASPPLLLVATIVLFRVKLARRARNPHWWNLDMPKVFCRPGTNFRYRREPPSNFHVCPLFGTPPTSGAPGDLEKTPKSASFCYETANDQLIYRYHTKNTNTAVYDRYFRPVIRFR